MFFYPIKKKTRKNLERFINCKKNFFVVFSFLGYGFYALYKYYNSNKYSLFSPESGCQYRYNGKNFQTTG